MDHGSCESNWGKYVRNRLIVVDRNKISCCVHLNLCFYTLPHTNFTWTKNNPKMSDNWQYSLSHTFYMRTNRQHNASLIKNILSLTRLPCLNLHFFRIPAVCRQVLSNLHLCARRSSSLPAEVGVITCVIFPARCKVTDHSTISLQKYGCLCHHRWHYDQLDGGELLLPWPAEGASRPSGESKVDFMCNSVKREWFSRRPFYIVFVGGCNQLRKYHLFVSPFNFANTATQLGFGTGKYLSTGVGISQYNMFIIAIRTSAWFGGNITVVS